MAEHTVVRSTRSAGWKVYRIETQSSRYHLALFPGGGGERRCAVIRGRSSSAGRSIEDRDSDPLADGVSLFDLEPQAWVGRSLEIGTTSTSAIREVAVETEPSVITAMTHVALARTEEKKDHGWAPYPENLVEYVETAASLLRSVYKDRNGLSTVRGRDELRTRLEVAAIECLAMLKGLARTS